MKLLSNLFFILCLPSILLHPVPLSAFQTPISSQEKMWDVPLDAEGKVNPWLLLNTDTPSIDRYFAFIDLICDETFLETLCEEELSRVVAFATAMVRASAPNREQELIDTYEQEMMHLRSKCQPHHSNRWQTNVNDFKIQVLLSHQRNAKRNR